MLWVLGYVHAVDIRSVHTVGIKICSLWVLL